jgi:site-specific recombinase XerD
MNSNRYFSIKLFLRAERRNSDGKAMIYARIRLDRDKIELSTHKSVKPTNWDDAKGIAIKTTEAGTINAHLETFKSKINNAYSQLYIAQQEITLDAIKGLVLGEPIKPKHTLLSVATEHNVHFKSMLGIKYSPGSYKNYKTTLAYLTEFVPSYTGKSDIALEAVNYKFCESFFTYLTTKKKCHTNGANKQLQRLKKIMNYAIKLGYIQTNPMATYTLEFEPVNKVALTIPEIQKLSKLKLHRKVLENVRDVFLMQCFTGLSYSDIKQLSAKHLSIAVNKTYWIHMERQKTKVSFAIPLLPQALVILQKHMPERPTDEPLFPVLSNQKMNENLKLIQELAGISKNLTTHLARHTFATTITLSNGVPIETVSRMLGHTKLSTTQIYAKVLDTKISKDMAALEQKLRRQDDDSDDESREA